MTKGNACAACGKSSDNRCSRCHLVFYCCKEHQKKHWKLHKSQCFPRFEIKCSEKLGRYLVATGARSIYPDEIIFQENPIAVGPKTSGAPICAACGVDLEVVTLKCSRCRWPVCSISCETSLLHQPECQLCEPVAGEVDKLVQSPGTGWIYDAILPLRILKLKFDSPAKWKLVEEMVDHIADPSLSEASDESNNNPLDPDAAAAETATKKRRKKISDFILSKVFPPQGTLTVSFPEINHVLGAIDVNGLDIRKEDAEFIALYPNAVLLEHSCAPNSKHVFDLRTFAISVKAAVQIKPGEHISTMYTHALWGTAVRRRHLWATKKFWCTCVRCSDPTECGTNVSALICRKCQGPVLPVDPLDEASLWKCSTANCTAAPLSSSRVEHLTCEFGQDVNKLVAQDASIATLETCREKHATTFHPNHFHFLSLNHTLLQLYGRERSPMQSLGAMMDHLEKKEALCQNLRDILGKLDPGGSRLPLYTAVVYFELHSALVDKYRCCPDADRMKILEEIMECLNKCQLLLRDEADDPSGARLMNVVQASFTSLEQRLKGTQS